MDRNPARHGVLGWLVLGLLLVGLAAPAPWASAEDDKDKADREADAEENPLETCGDPEAKTLVAELKKVSKKKAANVILPVLEKIEDYAHKDFEKPLLKLLKHESGSVALKSAEMWEWRVHKKVASKLWKAAWGEKKNDKRFVVKAATLKAFPRAGIALNAKQFKEVDRAWRWIVGNPNAAFAPALAAIAEYVELAKDKRLFRKLAEELDEPGTNINVNDGANPPESWWKARWELWQQSKPAVVSALQALTGQEFDTTAEAKAWLEANQKAFGVKW